MRSGLRILPQRLDCSRPARFPQNARRRLPGFRRHAGKIPHSRGKEVVSAEKTPEFLRSLFDTALAHLLPSTRRVCDVLRTAVLSIVLTLGVGQNAPFLCWIWCQPAKQLPAAACQHHGQATSSRIMHREICTEVVSTITFVREETRDERFKAPVQSALVIARLAIVPPAGWSPGHSPERPRSDAQPLSLPLRI